RPWSFRSAFRTQFPRPRLVKRAKRLRQKPRLKSPLTKSNFLKELCIMTWLIAGLGNPGPKYDSTRHNVGFMVADELARRARASFTAARNSRAEVAKTVISPSGLGVIPGESLLIVKPLTYMNESGQAVG